MKSEENETNPYPEIPYDQLKTIGYFSKTHGRQGGLLLKMEGKINFDLFPEYLFVSIDHIYIPFYVEETKGHREHTIVHFEGMRSMTEAEKLVGASVAILNDAFDIELHEDDIPIEMLEGYTLWHTEEGCIGEIIQIDTTTINTLAKVILKTDQEIFIPIVAEWIMEIDTMQKKVVMDFPVDILTL